MAANRKPASTAAASTAPTDYSDRALARIALSAHAATLARRAAALIDPLQDPPADPDATLLIQAANLVALAAGAHRAAVVHERARGAAWSEIGRQLGVARQTAQERFGSAVEDWTHRLAQDRSPAVLDPTVLGRVLRRRADFDAVVDFLNRERHFLHPTGDRAPLAFDETALADRIDEVAAGRDEAAAQPDTSPDAAARYRENAATDRLYAAELRAYAARDAAARAASEADRPVRLLPEDEALAELLRLVDEPLLSRLRLVEPDEAEELGQWRIPDTFALERAYSAFGRVRAALPEPVRRPREGDASANWLVAPDGTRTLVPLHAVWIDPADLAVLWQALEELRSALADARDDQLTELLDQVCDTDSASRALGPAELVDALARLLAVLTHAPDPELAHALRARADGDTLVLDPTQYAAYRRLAETWTLLLRSGREGLERRR
ncbi:hypothetical protein [Yinghuangia sp. YIM S09857]|uniref:hypothetical protein n=1 Tax=Yinghuangia sp. YIM S09857 TaxID=3436929 RepID=UPI003F536081